MTQALRIVTISANFIQILNTTTPIVC